MTDMLSVLVVAYYFPPMGFSGVQRVLGFVRYLPSYGWLPTVLTVTPRAYFAQDETLLSLIPPEVTVVRTDSPDPLRWLGKGKARTVNFGSERRRKWMHHLSQFLFIPDNKIGWLKPALEAGRQILSEQPHDVIFSSAPPYTAHLIGMKLSREYGLPLVADFRDPWVANPRHIYPTPIHLRRHRQLEREVVQHSDACTVINRHIKETLLSHFRGTEGFHRVHILPHGYDPADRLAEPLEGEDDRLSFLYTGAFYDAQQPDVFLHGVRRFLDRHPAWRERLVLHFAGLMPPEKIELIRTLQLESLVVSHGYVSHTAVVQLLRRASILWLTVGRQKGEALISLSKLGEYIGTEKPILGLVPGGAARDMLQRYGASYLCEPDDPEGVARLLERITVDWEQGTLPEPDASFVRTHSRRYLAGRLAGVFGQVFAEL